MQRQWRRGRGGGRRANGAASGGKQLAVIAGPCAVESGVQMMEASRAVREAGASILRGGAFKPRTSPCACQGLGVPGLKMMRQAADAHGLAVITGGPTTVDGTDWYKIDVSGVVSGWVDGQFLALSGEDPVNPHSDSFSPGDWIFVTDPPLNLRDAPSTSGTGWASIRKLAGDPAAWQETHDLLRAMGLLPGSRPKFHPPPPPPGSAPPATFWRTTVDR